MSTPSRARKRLPIKPSAEHLRKQAKRLAKSRNVPLAQAQHQLAQEYGAKNWTELLRTVETMRRGADQLTQVKNEMQPLPRAANANDLAQVQAILDSGQFTQHDLDLALARAVLRFNERQAIAQLLIDHGADPDGQYGSHYGPIVFVTGECLDPDGLQFLIDHGADVAFPPIDTKYGRQCPLSGWLGAYVRGQNAKKHRGIEILLEHHAHIPPEVTPEILALHRGDAAALAKILDQNPALATKHYPDMPYGNIPLAGATLLHAAVEFGELECLDLLLDRGANLNARTLPPSIQNQKSQIEIGPTPIFHAIASCSNANFYTLEHLIRGAGPVIDMSVKATFKLSDGTLIPPATPYEYARLAAEPTAPDWCRPSERELALLHSMDAEFTARHSASRQIAPESADTDIASAFLRAATPDPEADHRSGNLARAAEILDRHPSLPQENFYAACVIGDADTIQRHLDNGSASPVAPGGPRQWLPLCYLAFSRFLRLAPERSTSLVRAAKILLDHGADANSFWTLPSNPGYKETALYGAAGIANHAELTRLLLERGADPHDSESLYHAAEFQDNAALKVLLPVVTDRASISYCMCHKLDMEDPAGLQLFLNHQADPNFLIDRGQRQGDRPLHFALIRQRSAKTVQILLENGANPNLPDATGQSPYQLALRLGNLEAAELLLRHGAADDATPKLRLLAALSAGNSNAARQILDGDPALLQQLASEDHQLLIDAAASGNRAAVAIMLSAPFNFPVDIRKPKSTAWDGTALHHAAWHAHPPIVALLLQHGADPRLRHAYGGNALTTTLHAAIHHPPAELSAHLQTLTLLADYFSREEWAKALAAIEPSAPRELAEHVRALLQKR